MEREWNAVPRWPLVNAHHETGGSEPLVRHVFSSAIEQPVPEPHEPEIIADSLAVLETLDCAPDGSILRIRKGDALTTFTCDAQGRPLSMSDTVFDVSSLASYQYGDGFMLRTTERGVNFRYNLDGLGYVTTIVAINAADGMEQGTYSYSYTNCRNTRVSYTASGGSGGTEEVVYSDIAYDSDGRMIRRGGPKFTMTFDYGCW